MARTKGFIPPTRKRTPPPQNHPVRLGQCFACGALNPSHPKDPKVEKCSSCGSKLGPVQHDAYSWTGHRHTRVG